MLKYQREFKQILYFAIMMTITGLLAFIIIGVYDGNDPFALFHIKKNYVHNAVVQIDDLDQSAIQLSGEWEFYWKEFLDDDELAVTKEKPIYASIPGIWNKLKLDGKTLPGFGYGTYHLKIKGLRAGQEVAFYFPLLSVSYEVYADKTLVATNGRVSSTKEGFLPSFLPNTAYITPSDSEMDLIIHISNFVYARCGMWHSIYLGTPEQINKINRMIIYKDLFMIGAFSTLAVYYLSIYALRREKQSLLFVLLCIGATIRTAVNGDRVILRLFSDYPFSLLIKLDYIAILLFYPILMVLMTRRFPGDFNKTITKAFVGIGCFASGVVIFTPVAFFTKYVLFAEILMIITISYILIVLAISVYRLRKCALMIFLSQCLLVVLSLRDTLYQNAYAENPIGEIGAFGFLLFLLVESYAISSDYSQSFKSVEKLSKELLESDQLRERIRQTEMAFLQSQIKPHFLYNSLSVIDEYCKIDPNEASRLINSLAKYLRQSFDFENLETIVSIAKELELLRYYVEIECARFDNLKVEYQLDYAKEFFLPPLTIQPLVENAIRHGIRKKKGMGIVLLNISQLNGFIWITVKDNGVGIPAAKLQTLLSSTEKGTSVGLLNIHSRLLHQYGQGLTIHSEPGIGTTVSFIIPEGKIECEL
jgi:Putative regulator of cell autolysis